MVGEVAILISPLSCELGEVMCVKVLGPAEACSCGHGHRQGERGGIRWDATAVDRGLCRAGPRAPRHTEHMTDTVIADAKQLPLEYRTPQKM